MFLTRKVFSVKSAALLIVAALFIMFGIVFAKTVTRPMHVTVRTHIKICQKNNKGVWQKIDEVGPATLNFKANLLDLAKGKRVSSDYLFKTRSKKGKPYSVRLLKPADIFYNPVSGLFTGDLVYEISYGKKKATVPSKITTESMRGPLGLQKGMRAKGILAQKPMSVTLVSANNFNPQGGAPLMFVCKEEYKLSPAVKKRVKNNQD